ncbi:MAG: sigma-54-dependent Fis family transcriptional regulator [Bacteroidetes bacterium]|nr:sigma-54-dependent Fis family transcriptional regulator [Bacteroidota bacterium]
MALVLVADDVPALAEQYAYDLRRVGGYDTLVAPGGAQALDLIAAEPVDCVILDLEMPGTDGFEVLRTLRKQGISVPVIVYTGTGNYERCVQAVKLGAYGFIDKSESMQKVVQEVENALERKRLEQEIQSLRSDLGDKTSLIGTSPAMNRLRQQIERIARIPSPVLITGESGTGKELVAREIHRLASGDSSDRFVAINCAALPENLIESELFGHERGAFTGANRVHKGAFQLASGGTLLLDEIGELPLQAQAKLLRVLEENEITRVGGERTIRVDARVLAATNRDLESECNEGRFRHDLLFRLNVHIIEVPPLRDRRSDIPEMANHLLADICKRFGVRRKRISPEATELLAAAEWKRNNVRELRNVIERMVIASDSDMIGINHVPAEISGGAKPKSGEHGTTFRERKAEAERQILVTALDKNNWHISRTAQDLGLADHASLLKIMRRHGLKRPF